MKDEIYFIKIFLKIIHRNQLIEYIYNHKCGKNILLCLKGDILMVDLGLRIKQLRVRDGYTQKQLAEKIGVTKASVSSMENNIRHPSLDLLVKIANVFNVSTDYLLGNVPPRQLELSGLTQDEVKAIESLISAIKNHNR